MKISIVTISFNQKNYLKYCIDSVLKQNDVIIEYIIVDPGSTDGSRELIESYGDRISKVIFEPDSGPADGLNKGFSYATGDILYYLNSDDCLIPNSLSKVLRHFHENPKCDVLIGDGILIDENGTFKKNLYSSRRWSPFRYALGIAIAVQQSTFFKKNIFVESGGFNTSNRTCWDGELLVDMALLGAKICIVSDKYGYFRVYAESITGSGRLMQDYLRDQVRIQKKISTKTNYKIHKFKKYIYLISDILCHPFIMTERMLNKWI